MAISNSQYDEIMREYELLRENSRHTLSEHKQEVFELIPEYKEIDNRITDIALESAARYFDGDKEAITSMKEEMSRLQQRQAALLEQFSFPKDYLVEKHTCADCNDTGYIDNKKCHCLKQRILKILYKQSNIEDMLDKENFSTLSYDYYDDSEIEGMKNIIGECKRFADDFGKDYENLLFFGSVGVGKTFLTNCIAREVLDKGNSVIYFTSIRLFDTLSQYVFHKDDEDASGVQDDLFTCDLLIIDDLGTEMINNFVISRLFDIINERDIRKKPTIITTNLNMEALYNRYAERNVSRILGNYKVLEPKVKDIRGKKRRQFSI